MSLDMAIRGMGVRGLRGIWDDRYNENLSDSTIVRGTSSCPVAELVSLHWHLSSLLPGRACSLRNACLASNCIVRPLTARRWCFVARDSPWILVEMKYISVILMQFRSWYFIPSPSPLASKNRAPGWPSHETAENWDPLNFCRKKRTADQKHLNSYVNEQYNLLN